MDFAAKATCLGGAWGGPIARAHEPPRRTVGFTLIELMVVLVLVMLISAIALPSVARIFDSGADAMAYNLISAQLESARMYALENGTPAGIHVQLADPAENPDLEGVQYVTVIARSNAPQEVDSGTASSGAASTLTDLTKTWEVNDQTDHLVQITGGLGSGQTRTIQSNTADTLTVSVPWDTAPDATSQYTITDPELGFIQAAGHVPRAMPRSMAAGDAENFCANGTWQEVSNAELTGDGLAGGERCFTRFSMVFGSTGVLVRTVGGQNVRFKTHGDGLFSGATKLWDPPAVGQEEPAVTALTIFNYSEVSLLDPAQRQAYLNQSAQYLPVNFYTGMLYFRKGQ